VLPLFEGGGVRVCNEDPQPEQVSNEEMIQWCYATSWPPNERGELQNHRLTPKRF
jgi:hypothetical protein